MSRYLERVLLGDDRGALSWLVRALLWPFSLLYRAGLALFLGVYAAGLRKRFRVPVPVISVGNLTFGGTGKTPAVQAVCRLLCEQGLKVAVLSRGHGGSARGSVVVSDGKSLLATSAVCGDEPVLLAKTLPGVPVIVGKDRRESGALACREFRPDAIVLDDGLQYWQLHRDLDLVVLDAVRPFGSGFVMPMGDLREPARGLRRANVVLLTGADGLDDAALGLLTERIAALAPRALVLACARRAAVVRDSASGEEFTPDWLKGRRVFAFCGIGRPASFTRMLESLGVSIVGSAAFPDHHRFSRADIARIKAECESTGAELTITTEKDAARLGDAIDRLYVLGIELEIQERERLAQYITDGINGKNKAAAAQETSD